MPSPSPTHHQGGLPAIDHIVVIVMENHEYGSVIGNPDAYFITSLAGTYSLATNDHATSHPSLPNYLDMVYGKDFGIHDDGEGYVLPGPNIATELHQAGLSWSDLNESMPDDDATPCSFPSAAPYAKKHNPFAYSSVLQSNTWACSRIDPYAVPRTLARFTFVTPDLCHDVHDCPISTGDRWLSQQVPRWLGRMSGHDLLILTFDEGTTNDGGGGHIATIVAGPGARHGTRDTTSYSHFSLLRTVEDAFGLPYLDHAGDPGVRNYGAMIRP